MATIPYAIIGLAYNRGDVQAAVDAATRINVRQIEEGRAPLWWDSSARYDRERHETLPGVERIQTAEELHAMGRGDCDDHAPALAASLIASGRDARAVVVESPGIGYHVIVVYRGADGTLRRVDPSALRGMYDGEEVGARRRRRGGKVLAAARRARELVRDAARLAPGSRARAALLSEARRLARMARSASSSEPDEGELEPDEGNASSAAPDEGELEPNEGELETQEGGSDGG